MKEGTVNDRQDLVILWSGGWGLPGDLSITVDDKSNLPIFILDLANGIAGVYQLDNNGLRVEYRSGRPVSYVIAADYVIELVALDQIAIATLSEMAGFSCSHASWKYGEGAHFYPLEESKVPEIEPYVP